MHKQATPGIVDRGSRVAYRFSSPKSVFSAFLFVDGWNAGALAYCRPVSHPHTLIGLSRCVDAHAFPSPDPVLPPTRVDISIYKFTSTVSVRSAVQALPQVLISAGISDLALPVFQLVLVPL